MDKDQRDFNEPSVLDFVKSKLSFGRGPQIGIPESPELETRAETQPLTTDNQPPTAFPWISLIALGLALTAQRFFEPPNASAFTGITFYLSALGLLIIAILRGEWTLAPLAESSAGSDPLTFRLVAFLRQHVHQRESVFLVPRAGVVYRIALVEESESTFICASAQ
ncbi:MAG: hypothetical protein HY258_04415 [Chloroflexi bacterium]|nr:hypothetical protein [Chloroflexota bacterium]